VSKPVVVYAHEEDRRSRENEELDPLPEHGSLHVEAHELLYAVREGADGAPCVAHWVAHVSEGMQWGRISNENKRMIMRENESPILTLVYARKGDNENRDVKWKRGVEIQLRGSASECSI
jgi:hypothetical protein